VPVPDVQRAPGKLSTRTEVELPASLPASQNAQPFGPLGACPVSRGFGASTRAAPIEPFSAGRYKVTFTADAELKTKLELARDLLFEHDHRHPLGKGGSSDPKNLRLLCRNHNRYAAEHEYGKAHVDRAIDRSRRERRAPTAADCPAGAGGGHDG
jgi:hypothetical protein